MRKTDAHLSVDRTEKTWIEDPTGKICCVSRHRNSADATMRGKVNRSTRGLSVDLSEKRKSRMFWNVLEQNNIVLGRTIPTKYMPEIKNEASKQIMSKMKSRNSQISPIVWCHHRVTLADCGHKYADVLSQEHFSIGLLTTIFYGFNFSKFLL